MMSGSLSGLTLVYKQPVKPVGYILQVLIGMLKRIEEYSDYCLFFRYLHVREKMVKKINAAV